MLHFWKLEEQNIVVMMVPAETTDKLQTMDVGVNKAAKDFLRESFDSGMQRKLRNSSKPVCGRKLSQGEHGYVDDKGGWGPVADRDKIYNKLCIETTIVGS